ncbi:hypothetical protein HYH02_009439 [Chlamydomonas schloesseri]|uniref:Phosphoglycerate mutase n=1 Tax=Chlamydomonas schloesseri TaxID=2026947 RepID=A0A835W9D9_9CHLO|nr:hypothetical protein HYH02_009439 [Chlamydomonas schloesseri]|eukprot:KAG2443023.1 hypothetical protein HYH02_009439 [Chlamydomonas schloesseri]
MQPPPQTTEVTCAGVAPTSASGCPAGGAPPTAPAHTLVLIRHGQSEWNLSNRFTGWTDVDLTPEGERQALAAGRLLAAHRLRFDLVFTSVLRRAVRTAHILEAAMGLLHVQEVKSWRLNERHYGALQGLNKAETAARHGEEQVHIWRRSYATPPPALELNDPRHPRFDVRYGDLADEELPATESLKDCVARSLPFYHSDIAPAMCRGRRVLVAAHGNSLRGIVKHLDGISDEDIMKLEIPVGCPLVYELDEHLAPLRHYYLGHELLASPPLDVMALPDGLGVLDGMGAVATLKVETRKDASLQSLLRALVDGGATSPDHVHSAATAAALAGDLAQAEELLLRGGLAAARFVFTSLSFDSSSSGGREEAAATAALVGLSPAGPAEEEAACVTGGAEGARGVGGEEGTGVREALKQQGGESRRLLTGLRRLAPLLDAARHAVVIMLDGGVGVDLGVGVQGSVGGAGGERQGDSSGLGMLAAPRLVEGVCAEASAVLGVDKKLLVALPAGMGKEGAAANAAQQRQQQQQQQQQVAPQVPCGSAAAASSAGMGSGGSEQGQGSGQQGAAWATWRAGGRVWGAGAAQLEEAVLVAQALSCATGALWTAQAVSI